MSRVSAVRCIVLNKTLHLNLAGVPAVSIAEYLEVDVRKLMRRVRTQVTYRTCIGADPNCRAASSRDVRLVAVEAFDRVTGALQIAEHVIKGTMFHHEHHK